MAKSLIIVESPAKTKTLKSFLGGAYQIEASVGHVRDLPSFGMGVDVNNDFAPTYVILKDRKDVIERLAAAAKKADTVYLASDPDREGEAIAWHVSQALGLKNAKRITFNEITRSAVENAIRNPRDIDEKLVDAQEARRVLDRLVGYRLSPLLSSKIRSKLSAGRVQSVAVRLVCEREREILAFNPVEYWSLTATLTPQPPEKRFPFDAKFVGRDGKKIELPNEDITEGILRDLEGATYVVGTIKKNEKRRNPAAPFITSTLQQEASRKLGFANKRTMSVAQQLYEGIDIGEEGTVGLITYMRTDSTRVAAEAQQEARAFISERFGPAYVPKTPRQYAKKSAAQDAHEAVRPTGVVRTPDAIAAHLKPDQLKLYRLIWNRFVASQMESAIFDVTTADIGAAGFTFRATGSVMKFNGFMAVYTEGKDTEEKTDEEQEPLPALSEGQNLDLISLLPKQHFTEPPPRFTEATLVKLLDEKRVGRPSTWATIISTIQDREYVVLEERKFRPTELGFLTNDMLVKNFPDILDVGYTAGMESKLDAVEDGSMERVPLLREFYGPFDKAVSLAFDSVESIKPPQVETDYDCPLCGKKMMLRQSKRGPFLGCSGYPKCKGTLNVDEEGKPIAADEKAAAIVSDQKCPKCGKPMVQRESRRGPFLGCSGYPKCKGIINIDGDGKPSEESTPVMSDQKCPKCGKPLIEREGRLGKFLGCSGYPKCKTIVKMAGDTSSNGATAPEPTGIKCPKDGADIVAKKTRYGSLYLCANEPACDFKSWNRLIGRECPQCGFPLGEGAYKGRPTGTIKCSNSDCDYQEKTGERQLAGAAHE